MKGLRATGMRRSLGMLLALVAVARGFTPGMLPPLTRAAAARAPPPQLGPFTKVRTLFSSLRKSVKSEPETVVEMRTDDWESDEEVDLPRRCTAGTSRRSGWWARSPSWRR